MSLVFICVLVIALILYVTPRCEKRAIKRRINALKKEHKDRKW